MLGLFSCPIVMTLDTSAHKAKHFIGRICIRVRDYNDALFFLGNRFDVLSPWFDGNILYKYTGNKWTGDDIVFGYS